jgi:hypothetical protein
MKNRMLLLSVLVLASLACPSFAAIIQQEPKPEPKRTNVNVNANEVDLSAAANNSAEEELPVIFKLQTINGHSVWISEDVIKQAYESRFGKPVQAKHKKTVTNQKKVETAQAAPAPKVSKSPIESDSDEE